MSCVLADGSTTVSISSRNGRRGGWAMVRLSGVAAYCSGVSGAPSSVSDTSERPSPSSTSGAGVAALGFGFNCNAARTRVAFGSSETSSSTVSTSQSGGR